MIKIHNLSIENYSGLVENLFNIDICSLLDVI